jgi:hypothetical protein
LVLDGTSVLDTKPLSVPDEHLNGKLH